jgi:heme-degrading monooxygenase HmoA
MLQLVSVSFWHSLSEVKGWKNKPKKYNPELFVL